jgi:hypothetical protein
MRIETMGVGPGEMDVQLPFTGPVRPTPPPEDPKPKYGILFFGLILAGAYLILGGKKN